MTVEAQLRALGAQNEADQRPITVDEIRAAKVPAAKVPAATDSDPSDRSRRWLVAAAIVLLAAGGVALLAVARDEVDPLQPVNSVDVTIPVPAAIVTPTTTPSTTTAPDTIPANEKTSPLDQVQTASMGPIGAVIEPTASGTAAGETISLDWEGIVASTDLDAFAAPSLYVATSPTGYLMMDLSFRFDENYEESDGPRFWRSNDGIDWVPTQALDFGARSISGPLDDAYGAYKRIGNDHWIVGFDPPTVWRSTDTVEWIPVSIPEPARASSRESTFDSLFDAAGRALWVGRSGTGYWFSPETRTWVSDPDVVEPGGHTSPAAVGDRVIIAGATEVSISSPEGTTRIPTPWDADTVYVEGVGDTFVAYVGTVEDHDCCFEFHTGRELVLEQIWTSTDGTEWTGPIVPEFIDSPTSALFVNNNGVGAILTKQGLWTTRDWRVWTDTGVTPVLNDGDAVTYGNGALLVDQTRDRAWFSSDMESWHDVPVDRFALGERWIRGRMYAMTVDDLAYIITTVNPGAGDSFSYPDQYETDVWIIHQP